MALTAPAVNVPTSSMEMVRCPGGHVLGERQGARLIIRRLSLVLTGGVHTWTCWKCGHRVTIDLDGVASQGI